MKSIWDAKKIENQDSEDIHKCKFSIPAHIFQVFPEVTYEYEKDFEYTASALLVSFVESYSFEKKMALEFPESLDPQARAVVHALCNFLGLRSISHGKATRN